MANLELHSLKPGDHFSWMEDGPTFTVDETGHIAYDGASLVLYHQDGLQVAGVEPGLRAHQSDHTPVWLIA